MREIKFRAWSHNSFIYFSKPEDFKWFFGGFDGPERTLTDCKLNQYTGLKDKNGKEIYEGDIIYHHHSDKEYRLQGIVKFEVKWSGFYFAENRGMNTNTVYEIIGNIYEDNAPTQ